MSSNFIQITTSGYGTESAGVGRSDTLESVASDEKEPEKSRRDIFDDDDDDDLFKSARIEPEPRHVNGFGSESGPVPDKEINLDDDEEEEPPFKVCHFCVTDHNSRYIFSPSILGNSAELRN